MVSLITYLLKWPFFDTLTQQIKRYCKVTPIHHYVTVSAIGENRSDTISELTRAGLQCGCNLLNAKINVFGHTLSLVLFLSGNWGAIAKLETLLPSLEQRLGLVLQARRTHLPETLGKFMAYTIQIVSIDRPGILSQLADFISGFLIQIEEVSTTTYITHTGTRMASLQLKINVPENLHLATLREKFMSYCDDHNLDGFIEPLRHP